MKTRIAAVLALMAAASAPAKAQNVNYEYTWRVGSITVKNIDGVNCNLGVGTVVATPGQNRMAVNFVTNNAARIAITLSVSVDLYNDNRIFTGSASNVSEGGTITATGNTVPSNILNSRVSVLVTQCTVTGPAPPNNRFPPPR